MLSIGRKNMLSIGRKFLDMVYFVNNLEKYYYKNGAKNI
jgi:hypothetical protein